MKVPKMYKSSDLYDAGTDVIYNDESKLQYAPFIYATTGSGDSGGDGGDGGDDGEGEDSMVINITGVGGTLSLDKTWQEIYDAVKDGKCVYLRQASESDNDDINYTLWSVYFVGVDNTNDPNPYVVIRKDVYDEDGDIDIDIKMFSTDTPTGTPVYRSL